MLIVAGCTEVATGAQKPSEDRWGFISGSSVVAVVADGVTQPKDRNGIYPTDASRAADIVVRGIIEAGESGNLAVAIGVANERIRAHNEAVARFAVTDWNYCDRICTTAVVARAREQHDGVSFEVVSIGNSVALVLETDAIRSFSRDQLFPCHKYGHGRFQTKADRLAWQRGIVRNNRTLCDNGTSLGFGVLDGNPDASYFIETMTGFFPTGTLVVLASDAIRVLNTAPHPDYPDGYRELLAMASEQAGDLASRIVYRIRQRERELGARSDDATVVVIESCR